MRGRIGQKRAIDPIASPVCSAVSGVKGDRRSSRRDLPLTPGTVVHIVVGRVGGSGIHTVGARGRRASAARSAPSRRRRA